ncbi:MAG: hypothetical protein Q8S73_26655 [Deltaproteobacteria bacterium]|nr:hypothetical protein [Myxococcales bacterium]MDP3217717.1 hypothetical protein [Deltaproteobacteria bacterium]
MANQYVVTSATRNAILGAAALLAVGVGAGTVAAGDDSRITGAVQASTLTTNGDLIVRAAGVPARLGVGSEAQVLTVTSGVPAWATPAAGGAGSLGHSWARPSPASVPAGTSFINLDDLTEQISTGLAVSAGAAASGWMARLPTGLGAGRVGITGPTGQPRIHVDAQPLNTYSLGAVTLAALWTWDGSQATSYGFSELVTFGDSNNAARGIHIVLVTNGANTDLGVATNNVTAVLVPSANLLAGAVGLHSLVIAPLDSGGHKWRFSYDGSAVSDVAMGTTYVAPGTADSIGLGARPDGLVYLNGLAVELAVWPSLLDSADILALATLPGTPTYELPESASTGAATIRVQACRYDPRASLTTMPARGISKPVTVAATVTRTVL